MGLIEPHLNRPVGRPPKSGVQVKMVALHHQAKSWSKSRRVVARSSGTGVSFSPGSVLW